MQNMTVEKIKLQHATLNKITIGPEFYQQN